ALIVVQLAAKFPNGERGFQEVHRGGASQRADAARCDELDLSFEVLAAKFGFIALRRAIAGRAAFEDVADVNVLALEAHGADDPGQELPCLADKRLALGVFIGAWRFADEANRRIDPADAEYGLRACRA